MNLNSDSEQKRLKPIISATRAGAIGFFSSEASNSPFPSL